MEDLFKEHNVMLLCIILGSLMFGLPLAWNVLWHLKVGFSNDKLISFLPILTCTYHLIQVANDQSGRGVLRLLLIQQQINMICVPAMCLQIFLLANLPIHTPQWLCMFDGIMWTIVALNRIISDAVVAVGR